MVMGNDSEAAKSFSRGDMAEKSERGADLTDSKCNNDSMYIHVPWSSNSGLFVPTFVPKLPESVGSVFVSIWK